MTSSESALRHRNTGVSPVALDEQDAHATYPP